MGVRPVFRFAPSPNGLLHLGHALSALTCARCAEAAGGRFLLRIEDIDPQRCRPEYVDAIFDDLRWLGLVWEEPVLRQSARIEAYQTAAAELEEAGLLYPCFASRAEIARACDARVRGTGAPVPCDPDGAPLCSGVFKGLPAGDADILRARGVVPAMRLDMAAALDRLEARTGRRTLDFTELDGYAEGDRQGGLESRGRIVVADPARWGDAVIQRKDTPTSYHLAVVIDDAFQGVTHVVRGQDLFAATDLHRLLQWLFDIAPPVYHHHRLLTDAQGQKLSKSARSTSLRGLRDDGMTASEVRRRLGFG